MGCGLRESVLVGEGGRLPYEGGEGPAALMSAMHSLVDSSHRPLQLGVHSPEDEGTQRGPVTAHSRRLLRPIRISDLSVSKACAFFFKNSGIFKAELCVSGVFAFPTLLGGAWTIGGPQEYFSSIKYGHKPQGLRGSAGS